MKCALPCCHVSVFLTKFAKKNFFLTNFDATFPMCMPVYKKHLTLAFWMLRIDVCDLSFHIVYRCKKHCLLINGPEFQAEEFPHIQSRLMIFRMFVDSCVRCCVTSVC